MQKKVLLIVFAFAAITLQAQNFDKVKTFALLGKNEEAKVELDKALKDPKAQEKAEGYMWKGKLFGNFYKDEKLRAKYPNADKISYEAYMKYISLDPSLKLMKDYNAVDGLFDVYGASFNAGIASFNAKKWDSSTYYFENAVRYSDILFQQKLTSSTAPFDTTSILYAGYSAQNAKNEKTALVYYNRLMEAKIGGNNYIDIYRYALQIASAAKDKASFDKYLVVSKEVFAKEDWEDYEIDYINKNYSLEEKIAMYEKEDAAGTLSVSKYLQFGDMFANLPKDVKEKLDSITLDKYQHRAAEAFSKAAKKDPTDGIAAFNTGVIYYNIFGVFDDRVSNARRTLQELTSNYNDKSKAEKDPKKKAALAATFKAESDALKKQRADVEVPTMQHADLSIEYLEKTYNILKDKTGKSKTETGILSKSVDFLSNLFAYKRDKSSGKDPKAYDAFDAKFKFYDALHGKF
jgi:hypothetical protein